MDIAAMSTALHGARLQQEVSVAILSKIMDMQGQAAQTMLASAPAMQPPSSHLLDTRA